MNPTPTAHDEADDVPPRRGFLIQFLAAAVGAVVGLVPLAAGAVAFLDPLRRRAAGNVDRMQQFVRVSSLDALPVGGPPQAVPVIAARTDAWTHYPPSAIGSVYLQRTAENEVLALHSSCPHAGCFVDFNTGEKQFQCPCHTSAFAVDGAKIAGPSPRGLDRLEVDPVALRHGEVRVRFENFLAGIPEKIVVQ